MTAYSFGSRGTARKLLGGGWAKPETKWTWSVGARSDLLLPCEPDEGDLFVTITATPFVRPAHPRQRFTIEVGGETVARFEVDRIFSRSFRASRRHASRGMLPVTLVQPDARRGTELGLDEPRELALCLHRLHVEPVPALRPGAPHVIAGGHYDSVWESLGRPMSRATGGSALLAVGQAFAECWENGAFAAAADLARALAPDLPPLTFALSPHDDAAEIHATFAPDGSATIGLAATLPGAAADIRHLVGWRFATLLPLFATYAAAGALPGTMALNLGDDPHTPGIGFCGRGNEVLLIADPYFLGSNAYADLHAAIAQRAVPFRERKPVAVWRGSTSGHRTDGTLATLPRVMLCRVGRTPEAQPWMDAGLTSAEGLSVGEAVQAQQEGLFADFIPQAQFSGWMFQIDIDGYTNSWPGLFGKLATGGVVLKIASPREWTQWYYDRLEAFVNYVPVAGDFSDLLPKIKYLAYNLDIAERIGAAGCRLAQSLTYAGEAAAALPKMENAVALRRYRLTTP